jgi:endonuclease/exonuclease/phosphatase family metal-dependent hydrolase
MKLMCLNTWGGKLAEKLIPFLELEAPDVLCLQEVVHTPASKKEWLIYRDDDRMLLQRANLFRDLVAAFPDHLALFCPAAQGVLWDDTMALPSQFGLATFVHRSLAIVAQTQAFVHKDFTAEDYGEHPRPRNAHGLRLFHPETRLSFSVTHMHGLRDERGKMDTQERAVQSRRLMEISDEVSRVVDLRIICGDFNVEPQSEMLQSLAARGFVELVTGRGHNGTRSSLYPKSGRYADYMLIDDESSVLDFRVVRDPEISDHCPLILQI